MKAAALHAFGEPRAVDTLPDPTAGPDRSWWTSSPRASPAMPPGVFDGTRSYPLELPIAPGLGGVGRVRALGPGSTGLKAGDWVVCEPTIQSRGDAADTILQG